MANLNEKSKPSYQPWNEEAFQADLDVRYLTTIQRWMYRTLCQAAFFCSTRPYLPDDDKQLWKLSGCENREQWEENKEAVRDMFTPVISSNDGKPLLSRKRIEDDWKKLAEYREKQAEKGRKSAQKQAEQPSPDEPQPNHSSTTAQQRLTTVDHGTTTVNQISKEKLSEVKKREVSNSEDSLLKKIAGRYEEIFGDVLIPKRALEEKYRLACSEFGEDFVLEQFDTWAFGPRRASNLYKFFKDLPVLKEEILKEQSIQSGIEAAARELEERRKFRQEEQAVGQRIKENPDLIFNPR